MAFTLVSVSRMDKAGYELRTKGAQCHILNPKGKTVGIVPLIRGLYRVTDPSPHGPVKALWNVESVKIDTSDCRGERFSDKSKDHLKREGTEVHLTVRDSPQQNNTAERANRTHPQRAQGMNTPGYPWKEAISHSVRIGNHAITCALKDRATPLQKATSKKPNLVSSPMRDSSVWVELREARGVELQTRKAILAGVSGESVGFQVRLP